MDSKGVIYCLPGLGADHRLFSEFAPDFYRKICIDYVEPLPNENISAYALRLVSGYDLSKPFFLAGISLGGIMAAEIAAEFEPKGVIFISTIKNSKERAPFFKIGKKLPIPGFKFFKKWMPLGKNYFRNSSDFELFKSMLDHSSEKFGDWAVQQVIHWKFMQKANYPYIHINGSKDELFPTRYIEQALEIEGGRHDMTLYRWNDINPLVNNWLAQLTS